LSRRMFKMGWTMLKNLPGGGDKTSEDAEVYYGFFKNRMDAKTWEFVCVECCENEKFFPAYSTILGYMPPERPKIDHTTQSLPFKETSSEEAGEGENDLLWAENTWKTLNLYPDQPEYRTKRKESLEIWGGKQLGNVVFRGEDAYDDAIRFVMMFCNLDDSQARKYIACDMAGEFDALRRKYKHEIPQRRR